MEFHIDILNHRYSNFDKQTEIFLIATFMYHNGVINRAKALAMYKLCLPEKPSKPISNRGINLAIDLGIIDNTKKSDRYFKRTYKCSITGKWHDHEGILSIYREAFEEKASDIRIKSLTLEEMIGYVNLMLNKGRNFCIDHIKYMIVDPHLEHIITRAGSYGNESMALKRILGEDFSKIYYVPYDDFKVTSYCCEDCDGDYDYAKRSSYEWRIMSDLKKQSREIVSNKLDSEKKDMYYINLAVKEGKINPQHWYNPYENG